MREKTRGLHWGESGACSLIQHLLIYSSFPSSLDSFFLPLSLWLGSQRLISVSVNWRCKSAAASGVGTASGLHLTVFAQHTFLSQNTLSRRYSLTGPRQWLRLVKVRLEKEVKWIWSNQILTQRPKPTSIATVVMVFMWECVAAAVAYLALIQTFSLKSSALICRWCDRGSNQIRCHWEDPRICRCIRINTW